MRDAIKGICSFFRANWQAVFTIAFLGVLAAAIGAFLQWQQIVQRQAEVTPLLVQLGPATREDGYTYVLFENRAIDAKAIIYRIELQISDTDDLDHLERVRPKPTPAPKGSSSVECCFALVDESKVFFEDGNWTDGGGYAFVCTKPLTTEESNGIRFQLAINDPQLRGREFHGKLLVHYNAKEPAESTLVSIPAIGEEPKSVPKPVPVPSKPNTERVRLTPFRRIR